MDEVRSDLMKNECVRNYGVLLSKLAIVSVCIYVIFGIILTIGGVLGIELVIWIFRSIIAIALISSILAIILLRKTSDKNINKISEAKLFAHISLVTSLGIIILALIIVIFNLPV